MTISPILTSIQELIDVVAQLRAPQGGCPWDLAQTPESLIPYIIEEAYEVVDAIRRREKDAIVEELGDLLLQVILQAQIASEVNDFTLEDVAKSISEKLIRRHPHVFGDMEVNSVEEVHQNWEQIKAEEKGETDKTPSLSSKLSKYTRQMPPLMAGMKISKKAAAAGFEWETVDDVWTKFHEELGEFQHALKHEDKAAQQGELGDLLFVIINLARWHELDPSDALHETNLRFIQRFSKVEAYRDRPLSEYSIAEFERLWQQAKAELAQQKSQKQ